MVRQGTKRGQAVSAAVKAPWHRKLGGLCAVLAVAGFVQVSGVPGLSDAGFGGIENAHAQKKPKRQKPKTRRAKSVSDKVGKQLLKVQEAILADNNAEALAILNRLLQSEMKPFDRAMTLRMLGSVHADEGNYKKAISVFEEAQRLNVLGEQAQADLQFYLGQLYLAEDRVNEAIAALEAWFGMAGDAAAPQAYFVLAQAYAMKDNFARSLELAEAGMAKARLLEGGPRENWFRFTSSMYYQNKKIPQMQALLREMVGLFPGNATYWSQLSATYSILGDDDKRYHFRVMMYIQDMLKKSGELVNLAQLHTFNETPIRGARVMAKGFADKIVEDKADNYETLSIAYMEAREWKKSIKPMSQAASRSDDGDLYIRLCQSYLFDRKYKKAEKACLDGIKKGDLRTPGDAWMLLGSTRFNLGKLQGARKAFENAARFDKTRKNAENWINYIDNEIKRANAKAAAKKRNAT